MSNSNSVPSDEIFDKLSRNLFSYLLEAVTTKDPKDNRAGTMVMLILLAILAYAGMEAVKLIMRANFGKHGISTSRLVFSALLFLLISVSAYYFYYKYDESPILWASKSSFWATSIFYLVMSVILIYNGVVKGRNFEVNANYRGDSTILSFLHGSWKQSVIQNFAEPLLWLALGVYFLPYNYLWGVPLMFCAISTWMHLALEYSLEELGWARDYLSNAASSRNRGKNFTRASN